jgi:hypothetical protein
VSNTIKNYLGDLGKEIVTLAQKARHKQEASGNEFEKGRQFALYEVLSLMKLQTVTFGLDEKDVGLENINVEEFLT